MRHTNIPGSAEKEARLELHRVASTVAKHNILEKTDMVKSSILPNPHTGKKAALLELLQKNNRTTNYGGWLAGNHSPRDSSVGSFDGYLASNKSEPSKIATKLQMDELAQLAKFSNLAISKPNYSPRKKQLSQTSKNWAAMSPKEEAPRQLDSAFQIFKRNSSSRPIFDSHPYGSHVQNKANAVTVAEFDENTAMTPSLPKEISFTSRGVINGAIRPIKQSSTGQVYQVNTEPSYTGPYPPPVYQVDREYKQSIGSQKKLHQYSSKVQVVTDTSISGSNRRTDIDWTTDMKHKLPFAMRKHSDTPQVKHLSPFTIQPGSGATASVTCTPHEQAFKLYPLTIEEVMLLNQAESEDGETGIDFSVLSLKEAIELPLNQKTTLMTDVSTISKSQTLKQEDLLQNLKSVTKPKLNHERKDAKLLQIWYTTMLSQIESCHPKITQVAVEPVAASKEKSPAAEIPLLSAFTRTATLISYTSKQLAHQLRAICKEQSELLTTITSGFQTLTNKVLGVLSDFLRRIEDIHTKEVAQVRKESQGEISELEANNRTLKTMIVAKDELIHMHERTMASLRSKLYNDLVVIKGLRQENEFLVTQMELIQEENHKISKIVHDMNEATVG